MSGEIDALYIYDEHKYAPVMSDVSLLECLP